MYPSFGAVMAWGKEEVKRTVSEIPILKFAILTEVVTRSRGERGAKPEREHLARVFTAIERKMRALQKRIVLRALRAPRE